MVDKIETEVDEVEDDQDSTEESTTTHEEDEWTPPTREDYNKLVAAKQKADSEAAARKRYLRDAGFDPKTGQPIVKQTISLSEEDEDDSTTDTSSQNNSGVDREKLEKQAQRVLERETAKAETRGRSSAYSLIIEVPSALEDAGWNGKNLPRMIKLLDLDAVEVDSDGVDVETLTSQVAELKKDFPEFFKRSRMKDAVKEVADTETVGGGNKKAPASEEDQDWKARLRNQLTSGN